ncbi:MAG: Mur ligase family protein [Oscillospiraceae bacterium]|nr:Mur ligase family protein [Oscillospiraceae bacterium]
MKYIHVAGTNGKGSTCTYIARSLTASGFKVGLFTSPHLHEVSERITIDGTPIDCRRIPTLPPDCFFQTLWKTAREYFAQQGVDYAVVETGIGGLLDCTNEITPVVSVITKIGVDHTALLGDTIEEIVRHKAGIIKTGVPVVADPTQPSGALNVIRETARRVNAQVVIPQVTTPMTWMECNRLTATAALGVLGVAPCDLSAVTLPARFQTVRHNPTVIVDGAHNPDAIKAIVDMIMLSPLSVKRKIVVFGTQKSKDRAGCLSELRRMGVANLIEVEDVSCARETAAAISRALQDSREADMVLICGSLYLAGGALRYLEAYNED